MKKQNRFILVFMVLGLILPACQHFPQKAPPPAISLQFINEQILPKNQYFFQNIPVGGLSALAYDAENKVFLALSDDKGNKGFPPRFYKFKLFLKKGRYHLSLIDQVQLRDSKNQPFSPIDPEGMAIFYDFSSPISKGHDPRSGPRTCFLVPGTSKPLGPLNSKSGKFKCHRYKNHFQQAKSHRISPNLRIFISSEGAQMPSLVAPPQVFVFNVKGQWLSSLPVWDTYWRPHHVGKWGVKENKAFEALSLGPKQQYLYLATESALHQDTTKQALSDSCLPQEGNQKTKLKKVSLTTQQRPLPDKHSLIAKKQQYIRIQQWDVKKNKLAKQFVYPMDLCIEKADMKGVNGLTDFVAFGKKQLLVVERSYLKKPKLASDQKLSANLVRLFQADCSKASDVSSYKALYPAYTNHKRKIVTCDKTLIADLSSFGPKVDNIEGIALGPEISKGKYLLVLVSDNNFSQKQKTQFLFFYFIF